ncbi:unnamed protein product [Paramecium pentaurelia]|uniref:Uncharacterized protein n=1 Tax=Paramecium pentaurelia TaxID=43138 RepID=A0A8S1WEZ3_9CILI|nr:unnamed protein product [Paramecium pentaurelia]
MSKIKTVTLQEDIIEKLKNTKMSHLKIEELSVMIVAIFGYKQKFQESQFLLKQQQLEEKLQSFYTNLIQVNQFVNKNKGFLGFFKQSDEIKMKQQEIYREVKELYQQTINFFEDSSHITASSYTKEKQVIDQDFIEIQIIITVNHPKFLPIKSELNSILLQAPYSDVYESVILRRKLIRKVKEKTKQILDQDQIKYLDKFNEKKSNTQVFVVSYSRQNQTTEISSEIYPYVITTNNQQNRIYLCKGMKLKFFPQQTLIVMDTNTKNENLTNFSGVTQYTINQPLNNNIQIADYAYIKFEYFEVDQDLEEKQQKISKEQHEPLKGTIFEFYLNNSKQQISDTIPLINATLYHQQAEGFYILPNKTETQNFYKLYYKNYMHTKQQEYNFGLQISKKGWIQIETQKSKAKRLNL